MQKIFFIVILFFIISANSNAIEIKSENTMRAGPYKELYAIQGPSDALPKILVFSAKGECIGVATADSTPADELTGFIEKSIKSNKKKCNMIVSEKFGVTTVGNDSGTGKKSIHLIIFGESFCTACAAYKKTLVEYIRPDITLKIIRIDTSKK